MSDETYHGHATLIDGTHVPLSAEDAKGLWEAAEAARRSRAERMPDTAAALRQMFEGKGRLRELGWRDGCYCPKDGTPFAAIQHGSTGIFTGWMAEAWPYGFATIEDCGTHPHGFMWKPLDALTPEEDAARRVAAADTKAFTERLLRQGVR